jgi:nitroreductase
MDVFTAIKTRRSIGKVKSDEVSKDLIETILEAGIWAPNHYRTEPWKFFVMQGEGRKKLGKVLGEIATEEMDESSQEAQEKRMKAEAKPLRAPVIIAVAAIPSDNPKVIVKEEFAAVSSAVQNMLLAAHALGLGAIWRTGKPTYHPKMQQLFSLQGNEEVVGFIYIGYPDMKEPIAKRIPYDQKTVWIDGK